MTRALPLLLASCGGGVFPLTIQVPYTEPGDAAAFAHYVDAYDAAVGCQDVTTTTAPASWRVVWTTQAGMARQFSWLTPETVGVSDLWGQDVWIGTDCGEYECPTSDEIGRLALNWIGWLHGLASQCADKSLITWCHPSQLADPVAELLKELKQAGVEPCPEGA